MVYKIRNKTFNVFTMGTTPRAYPCKKTQTQFDIESHVTLQVHISRFTGMRIMHNYRNISRACKQFCNGDRLMEQYMILCLKEHFFRPMRYRAPIHQTFFMVSFSQIVPLIILNLGPFPRRSFWQTHRLVLKQPTSNPIARLPTVQWNA